MSMGIMRYFGSMIAGFEWTRAYFCRVFLNGFIIIRMVSKIADFAIATLNPQYWSRYRIVNIAEIERLFV